MKEIARSLEFPVEVTPKARTSWLKHEGLGVNILVPPSVREFYRMRDEMIRNKDIDIGELIVPIQYEVVVVDKDGKLVSTPCLSKSG